MKSKSVKLPMRDIFASSIRKWSSLTWAAITARYPAHTLHVNLTRPRFEGKKGMSRGICVWGGRVTSKSERFERPKSFCVRRRLWHTKSHNTNNMKLSLSIKFVFCLRLFLFSLDFCCCWFLPPSSP